jgi:RND superfamily putative drug exporter
MTSLAVGGALVVGAAALASLTLLPALLGVLGPRVNALRLPLLGKLAWRAEQRNEDVPLAERRGFWQTWARAVMRRPLVTLLLVAAVLIGVGWPVLSINVGSASTDMLPASAESRAGLDILNQQFPDTGGNVIQVIAQTPDGSSIRTRANLERVANLTEWLNEQNGVSDVSGLMRVPVSDDQRAPSEPQLLTLYTTGGYARVPGMAQLLGATTSGDTTLITVKTSYAVESGGSKALVDHLRAGDAYAGAGLRVLVGGEQATSLDFTRYLYANFPRAILFILAATFVLLLLMFRSLLLPLKAILMNVLSVSAAFGVLVWVFQWGHFSNILGFTSDGVIDSIVPILMFCVLFGLSMDYEVFLLSRIREEWLRTHNNRWAVARGMEQTGGVITNAALLFVIVTGAFTFTRLVVTKEIGLGMTVAVLVDAAVIRMLLVPATMRLLGRWNWWLPGRPLPPKQV